MKLMKQKKKNEEQDKQEKSVLQETEKTEAGGHREKKVLLKNTVCMLVMLLGIAGAASAGSILTGADLYNTVRNLVFCVLAALAAVFSFQAGRVSGSFFYDDGEHPGRFLCLYLCGILCALIYTQLPATGWMFLFFYVSLSRVSDSVTGICAGTSLLILTAVLCGQASPSVFLVYFLSGMIGIAMFAHQKDEFYIAVPSGLALGSQLLLIFAEEMLVRNNRLVWRDILMPFANVAMNCILLCIFMRYYINRVAKKEDNLYLLLNNQEYTAMVWMRENEKEKYDCAIHTAYLVERITSELDLDVRSAKCVAYYVYLPVERLKEIPFPEPVKSLLLELKTGKKALMRKEAVIVQICHQVVREIQKANAQNRTAKVNYGQLITQIFERRFTIEKLAETEITLSNLRYIKKRLLKEKMYYESMTGS